MFDPYEVLGLSKAFAVDERELERRYFELQRKHHPDQFIHASSEEKAQALKTSTELNQAYAVLKDPIQRAEILLKARNIEPLSHDEETLALVMEFNEKVEAGEDIKPELSQMQQELFTDIEKGFDEADFEAVRQALFRQTYVTKLLKDRK